MSSVLKGEDADKVAFSFQPRPIRLKASDVARDFVERQGEKHSAFRISDVVSEAAGIEELRRHKLEAEVEETVLQRMKDIEEQAYKQAYDLGFIEGEKKAFDEKRADLDSRLSQLDELIVQLNGLKLQILQQNEIHFMNLIFKIAERIAMKEVEINREPLGQVIKEIVENLNADDRVNIHISQNDFDFIEDLCKRNEKQISQFENVKLIAASDMQTGGCTIETNFGAIDATIPQRVAKVWDAIHAKFPLLRGHKTDLNEGSSSDERD